MKSILQSMKSILQAKNSKPQNHTTYKKTGRYPTNISKRNHFNNFEKTPVKIPVK